MPLAEFTSLFSASTIGCLILEIKSDKTPASKIQIKHTMKLLSKLKRWLIKIPKKGPIAEATVVLSA